MTNEAIEAAARAITKHTGWPTDYDNLEPVVQEALRNTARAAAPALMEAGARLALEAMRPLAHAAASAIYGLPEMLERNALTDEEGMISEIKMALAGFRALDPAAIVKGAGHE
jgi:hypothetical protein